MDISTPIYVTRPSLPPLEEFIPYLEKIWESRCLTNCGPYHKEFEEALCTYLGVKYCSLFCNGMMALQVGLQALKVNGEVITTPYSFAATTHAIYWNRCTPVFCDIDPATCNIDVNKIESLITPETTAIMPVHVYGTPCDVEAIARIADTYGLKLLYDAAHAFGVNVNGSSVLNFGDLSMVSFHATKAFTTFEGGALITNNEKLKKRIDFLKNFGFANEVTVVAPGSNGKMNELQAACGLLQLKYVDRDIARCKAIIVRYQEELKCINGIRTIKELRGVTYNYSYFPILVNETKFGRSRDELCEMLKKHRIHTRKYFYPLISQFPSYRDLPSARPENLPVAEEVARQVLCLPVYPELTEEDLDRIIKEVSAAHRKRQKVKSIVYTKETVTG